MPTLKLYVFPDRQLTVLAQPIDELTPAIKQLSDDLLATLYDENLFGIAATHAGIAKQMIAVDISETRDQPQVFINPNIIEHRGNQVGKEAGIAVPGIELDIPRATWIKMEALNLQGEKVIVEAEDLYARVLQHEIDQMQGIIFIDRVSKIKRDRAITKFNKMERRCGVGCGHNHH